MKQSADNVVLELEEVSTNDGSEVFSLELGEGDLLLFNCDRGLRIPDVWDLFVGMDAPCCGGIRFCGELWEEMSAKQQEAQRLKVGCVFTGSNKYEAPWLENLDIDENVRLAQSMNPARSETGLQKRIDSLLDDFGMSEIPGVRPAAVGRIDSMKSQWIRAFLPDPLRLLILERPIYGMSSDDSNRFLNRVNRAREEEKTAVVWIDVALSSSEVERLNPTQEFTNLPACLL